MTIFLQNFALQATKLCTKICILILCEHALIFPAPPEHLLHHALPQNAKPPEGAAYIKLHARIEPFHNNSEKLALIEHYYKLLIPLLNGCVGEYGGKIR